MENGGINELIFGLFNVEASLAGCGLLVSIFPWIRYNFVKYYGERSTEAEVVNGFMRNVRSLRRCGWEEEIK